MLSLYIIYYHGLSVCLSTKILKRVIYLVYTVLIYSAIYANIEVPESS